MLEFIEQRGFGFLVARFFFPAQHFRESGFFASLKNDKKTESRRRSFRLQHASIQLSDD